MSARPHPLLSRGHSHANRTERGVAACCMQARAETSCGRALRVLECSSRGLVPKRNQGQLGRYPGWGAFAHAYSSSLTTSSRWRPSFLAFPLHPAGACRMIPSRVGRRHSIVPWPLDAPAAPHGTILGKQDDQRMEGSRDMVPGKSGGGWPFETRETRSTFRPSRCESREHAVVVVFVRRLRGWRGFALQGKW